jgi:hypothetical protein
MDAATSKHQLALPHVLAFTPGLAALHASRTRLQHHRAQADAPALSGHCAKCGSYLYDGSSPIRIVRARSRKRKRSSVAARQEGNTGSSAPERVLQQTCGACEWTSTTPVPSSGARSFPAVRKRGHSPRSHVAADTAPQPLPAHNSQPTITPIEAESATSTRTVIDPPSVNAKASHAKSLVSDSHSATNIAGSGSQRDSASHGTHPLSVVSAFAGTKSSPAPTTAPSLSSTKPKARPKKKTGLQDMLARNREKQLQQQQQGKQDPGSGLAAFLSNL